MADRTVEVCPDCDSSEIYYRTGWKFPEGWICKDCGTKFDEPTERPAKRTGLKGLAKQLADADPDDVGGDQR